MKKQDWILIVSENLLKDTSGCTLEAEQHTGQLFDADFLLTENARQLEQTPLRTFLGPRYLGGYSDHLPIYIDRRKRR